MEGNPKRKSEKRAKTFGSRKFSGSPFTRAKEAKAQNVASTSGVRLAQRVSTADRLSADNPAETSDMPEPVPGTSEPVISTSTKKLRRSLDPEVRPERQNWSGFRVVDVDMFTRDIFEAVVCSQCKNASVMLSEKSALGFYSIFDLVCSERGVVKEVASCGKVGDMGKAPEANRRAVYAFKSLGLGYQGLTDFSALMDMPPPVSKTGYQKGVDKIHRATESVAEESMKRAAQEEQEMCNSSDVTVSGDGSWMKRGFTSLFGVMILIGLLSGKVIDFVVLSLFCSVCARYKGPASGEEYEDWLQEHSPNCTKNHEGSSGSMEVQGTLQMFARSVKERALRYLKYIDDGDSKTFKAVSESKPYGNTTKISKMECSSHVKKRMGTRLRNLVKESKGQLIGGKKGLGGVGRLTQKMIDRISSYYGKAIQSNHDVESMYNAIWAIFYHLSSSDSKPTHHLCAQGPSSWCPYQKAVSAGNADSYKHKRTVPLPVMEACRKVLTDLSSKELLERCVGGFTQNPNESFNALIWKNCPKVKFCGKKSVDIAACEAVLTFNDGVRSKVKVLELLGVPPGKHCVAWAIRVDKVRTAKTDIRAQAATKEARIEKRKQQQAVLRANEDDSYVPGGYYS